MRVPSGHVYRRSGRRGDAWYAKYRLPDATHARARGRHVAGPDALLCILEDTLLAAERRMVTMGEHMRVRESRMYLQVATAEEFVTTVEAITGRTVPAFATTVD